MTKTMNTSMMSRYDDGDGGDASRDEDRAAGV